MLINKNWHRLHAKCPNYNNWELGVVSQYVLNCLLGTACSWLLDQFQRDTQVRRTIQNDSETTCYMYLTFNEDWAWMKIKSAMNLGLDSSVCRFTLILGIYIVHELELIVLSYANRIVWICRDNCRNWKCRIRTALDLVMKHVSNHPTK